MDQCESNLLTAGVIRLSWDQETLIEKVSKKLIQSNRVAVISQEDTQTMKSTMKRMLDQWMTNGKRDTFATDSENSDSAEDEDVEEENLSELFTVKYF